MAAPGSLLWRLWNFGAWARLDPCAPDGSCENPLYRDWIPSKAWDSAWGEQISPDPGDERVIDEQDAEALEASILLLDAWPRAIIVSRFVLRNNLPRLEVDAAIRALGDIIDRDWAIDANSHYRR